MKIIPVQSKLDKEYLPTVDCESWEDVPSKISVWAEDGYVPITIRDACPNNPEGQKWIYITFEKKFKHNLMSQYKPPESLNP